MSNVHRVSISLSILTLFAAASFSPATADAPQTVEEALSSSGASELPDGWYRVAAHAIPLSELVRGMFPRIEQELRVEEFRTKRLDKNLWLQMKSDEETALLLGDPELSLRDSVKEEV